MKDVALLNHLCHESHYDKKRLVGFRRVIGCNLEMVKYLTVLENNLTFSFEQNGNKRVYLEESDAFKRSQLEN